MASGEATAGREAETTSSLLLPLVPAAASQWPNPGRSRGARGCERHGCREKPPGAQGRTWRGDPLTWGSPRSPRHVPASAGAHPGAGRSPHLHLQVARPHEAPSSVPDETRFRGWGVGPEHTRTRALVQCQEVPEGRARAELGRWAPSRPCPANTENRESPLCASWSWFSCHLFGILTNAMATF